MDSTGLTFDALSRANANRSRDGFHRPINSIPPCVLATGLAGEVGEALNMLYHGIQGTKPFDLGDFARELADAQCFLDLLAQRMGIDLGEVTRIKFNEVSRRIGWNGPEL